MSGLLLVILPSVAFLRKYLNRVKLNDEQKLQTVTNEESKDTEASGTEPIAV